MREVKFRGIDISDCWHYGMLSKKDNRFYISNRAGIVYAYEVRTKTVGQYTGLKDINGKEIYEGDILITKDIEGKKYQTCVTYENGMFLSGEEPLYDDVFLFEAEVVGNIYENPELLDDENKRNQ